MRALDSLLWRDDAREAHKNSFRRGSRNRLKARRGAVKLRVELSQVMRTTHRRLALSLPFLLLLGAACSEGGEEPGGSGDGDAGTGGVANPMGSGGLGGGTGGAGSGGMGTGGGASGGAASTGGAATGGEAATGGVASTGGAGTGGDLGTGGLGTGGIDGTGGAAPETCPPEVTPMPAERTRLIEGQFTADPSAHVFDCKLYFYPSHDQDNANGFNMVDYHVFSLGDDGSFTDEGTILHLDDVPWATQYAWAPDAAYKDGTYYFYFPAKDSQGIFRVGVATADQPTGPFTAEQAPIAGSYSIDPTVFTDDDGKSYMYFGGQWGGQLECYNSGSYNASDCSNDNGEGGSGDGLPRVVALGDDMKSFSGSVQEVTLSGGAARFFEGAWMHKYDGKYYFSYSDGPSHRLHYAIGDDPMGPFVYQGVLLPDHGAGWTTHHSVVEFQGNWYLFYHDSACSGGNTNKRCVKYASFTHNEDGTIDTISP